MCICIFWGVFVYILGFSSYEIDSLISGGCRRRPPPISLSILYEENPKILTKTHTKNMQTHKNMCKNDEKYMKKCYVVVGNRTLAANFLLPGRGVCPYPGTWEGSSLLDLVLCKLG